MAVHKIFLLFFITLKYSSTSKALPVINCSAINTFVVDSTFESDLTALLSSLTSVNTDFYNTTVGAVYGLFMCRGDVPVQSCQKCVSDATQQLSSECKFSREAIIWYGKCMVRYSNRSFFSTVDTSPKSVVLSPANSSDQAGLKNVLNSTMSDAAREATKTGVGEEKKKKKYYATKEVRFWKNQTLYCLVQCTDLSVQDCTLCLNGIVEELPCCELNIQGGRIYYPSCNSRFELYHYYDDDDQPQVSTNSSDHHGKKNSC